MNHRIWATLLCAGMVLSAAGQEAASLVEQDWLLQAEPRSAPPARGKGQPAAAPAPTAYPVADALRHGRLLAADLAAQGVDTKAFEAEAGRLEAEAAQAAPEKQKEVYLKIRKAVRALTLSHPLLDFDKLLFVKRYTYGSSHIYTDFTDGSRTFGGNLCLLSPVAPEGRVTEVVPSLAGGIFGRYDLSFDAQRIVFAYKRDAKTCYHLYEVGVDGQGLRQITVEDPQKTGYCDDVDPCYLPSGRIVFASTRAGHAVLCFGRHPVTTLHTVDADGKNLRCLTDNTSSELTPAMMDDGRVLYMRWEYVDKGSGDVQSLWSVFPDGSHSAHVYKNNVAKPPTLIDARSIPGSRRLVATGGPHMPLAVGPIVLLDIDAADQTPAAMTNLTPEISWPTHGGYPSAKMGFYKEPWPLSEQLFLVAYSHGPNAEARAGYGLYVLNDHGGRELLYRDPQISCFQPVPLRPRPMPPDLSACVTAGEEGPAAPQGEATLFMQDVYEGMDGIVRGRVKYVRVMEDMPKPRTWTRGGTLGLQSPPVSLAGHFAVKYVHGVVPVQEDGSACFTVPSGKNLYFQALDENFMELQRMRTFVNLMPGETRGCIGCHESRRQAPQTRPALASSRAPRKLEPLPGDRGPRAVHYPTDVQPLLDRCCVSCHSGKEAKAGLELTGESTNLFSKSYEQLIKKGLVNKINVDPRDAFIPAEPPLRFGSHRSKVIERIRTPGSPCAAPLTREEFIRLVTWIDANAPYYGTYEKLGVAQVPGAAARP